MQLAQPNWSLSKLGNDHDQWGLYDDNDNGKFIAVVNGAYNARLIAAAPKLFAILIEIHDHYPWSRDLENLLRDVKGDDDVLHTD